MRIKLNLHREGGSHVDMGDGTPHYHFKPEYPGGPHVADVRGSAHIKRLLSIDGYEPDEDDEPAAPADKKAKSVAVKTTATAPVPFDEDDDGSDVEDDDTEVAATLIEDDAAPTTGEAAALDALDDAALDAEYIKVVGRNPHPRAGRDNKIAKIKEALAAGE